MSFWTKVKNVFQDTAENVVDALKWIRARPGFNQFLALHGRKIFQTIQNVIKANPEKRFHELKDGVRGVIREAYPEAPDNWIEGAIFFGLETLKATGKVK